MNKSNLHIIVAAGTGSRFGADLPKQFCLLAGRPVICHTVDAIRAAASDGDVIAVVISPAMTEVWAETAARYVDPTVRVLPVGGATRAATVANALGATADVDAGVITVHDGARPLAPADMIARLVAEASEPGSVGAIPATALTDSIRMLCPDGSSVAVERSSYRAVQTPQVFPAALLREAYAAVDIADRSLTDDASVVERYIHKAPALVDGDPDNIKITHPTDLRRAEMLLSRRK